MKNIEAHKYFYYPDIYLELDTEEDLKLIQLIFSYFNSRRKEHFGLGEIISFLDDHKDLIKINSDIHRKWKKFRSEDV